MNGIANGDNVDDIYIIIINVVNFMPCVFNKITTNN